MFYQYTLFSLVHVLSLYIVYYLFNFVHVLSTYIVYSLVLVLSNYIVYYFSCFIKRQERLDRIYKLNKRLRQGGSQSRKFSAKASNFSTSVFEASSTLRTISTAPSTLSSTYSANIPTPKIDKERGNYTLDVQPQQAIPEAKDPSDLTDQHQDIKLCPEIPSGLQVLVP